MLNQVINKFSRIFSPFLDYRPKLARTFSNCNVVSLVFLRLSNYSKYLYSFYVCTFKSPEFAGKKCCKTAGGRKLSFYYNIYLLQIRMKKYGATFLEKLFRSLSRLIKIKQVQCDLSFTNGISSTLAHQMQKKSFIVLIFVNQSSKFPLSKEAQVVCTVKTKVSCILAFK